MALLSTNLARLEGERKKPIFLAPSRWSWVVGQDAAAGPTGAYSSVAGQLVVLKNQGVGTRLFILTLDPSR
jgi:hypothetical protein